MKRLILGLTLFAAGVAAPAASFDCGKASTDVEKLICADSQVSALDGELAQAYQNALAGSASPAALKAAQKSWLAKVRNPCKDSACLIRAYQQRIKALGNAKPSASSPTGFTGTYENKAAEVKVQHLAADRIKFAILASYKMNTGEASGEASGEAALAGNAAVYENREEDCKLAFKFSPGKLAVKQEGICGMGLNVSASGNYTLKSPKPPAFDH